MNIQRFWKKFAVAFMALVLLLPCLAIPAFAYNPIDTSRETSLTVHFGEGSTDFSGVEFRIYRVADVSESGEFTLAGDFVDYPISLENLDNAGWRALAQTLAGYVARDHLDPYKTAKTDKNGRAFFDHLPTGLYLVMGDSYEKGRTTYTPDPFALCLPNPDGETGEWIYDVEASCKYDSEYDPPHGGGGDDDPSSGGGGGTPVTVTRRVQKIWDDSGHTENRPQEVVVQLLKDGVVSSTVTLSASNNWSYTWSGLDANSNWQVVERDVANGYTVLVEREGDLFRVTNTYQEDVPVTPPSTGESEAPPSAVSIEPAPEPGPEPEEKLPQTGMLWWPVPVLACGGISLFFAGWARRRRQEDSDV